jgi:hypothetical protein
MPVRVTMMIVVPVAFAAVAAHAATVAATMAAVHPAATVHSAAAMAATTAHGAGRRRGKHGKAERSARGDGQKGRFAKHGNLLWDPCGIV